LSIGVLVSSRANLFFGWWVVFASAAVLFLTGGTFFYGFGALFNPMVNEFGWSRAATSFAFSLRSEVGGIAAPIVGFLVDRVGPRRLMVFGVATVAAGYVALSQVQDLVSFYAAIVVIAIGMSAAAGPVSIAAVARWFRRRRGRALAVLAMGAGSSGVMVVVLSALISAFDWRNALLIIAGLQMAISLPLALSIRNSPADMGLEPDGDLPPAVDENGEPVTPGLVEPEGLTAGRALRTGAFWRLAISLLVGNLGAIAIFVHLIPFLTKNVDMSEGLAAACVTAMVLLSLIGRFGFGYLADSLDKRLVMGVSHGLLALAVLLFATVYEPWQVLYALPLFGIGWGGVIPVRPALQADVFGMRAFGAIQGLMFTIATFGALIGPVWAGWMYDQTESYRLAFVVLASAGFLAVPLVLTLRRPLSEPGPA
jgi:MFS family permease